MRQFDDLSTELKSAHTTEDPLFEAAHSLNREVQMITSGVGGALLDTVSHPLDKLPELGLSLGTGFALGAVSRLGAPGRMVAAGIGTAMMLKFGYDELTGHRWTNFGSALKDAWCSSDNMDQDIDITKNSVGAFLVDTGIGCAGMTMGSLATARYAPPEMLLKDAVRRADSDGGAALRGLQDRWENPNKFQNSVAGKLELIAHNQPAVPGEPRGDLLRVANTADGNVLFAAMDVTGHGVSAAKKAVTVQAAMDEILPQVNNTSANDILSMIDKKLGIGTEVMPITAGLMTYDPVTHELQTATASSELAYVVRADGAVQRLDAKVGGFGLGMEWYSNFPRGNEITQLGKGDTVVMVSDGVFDRFGYGNWGNLPESTSALSAFKTFLEKTGPSPEGIRRGILNSSPPNTGVDDLSFIVFRRPL